MYFKKNLLAAALDSLSVGALAEPLSNNQYRFVLEVDTKISLGETTSSTPDIGEKPIETWLELYQKGGLYTDLLNSSELDYHSILQRTFSDWGFRQ